MKKYLFGIIIVFSVPFQLRANGDDTAIKTAQKGEWNPSTSLYIELGGKFLPSLNVDFRRRENVAVSIGTGFWKDNEEHEQFIFTPSVNAYFLSGKRKRLEIGGGTGPFISSYSGLASILVFGNMGYRYQKKEGLFFRAGFTPFVGIPVHDKSRFLASPWAGISLGYSL